MTTQTALVILDDVSNGITFGDRPWTLSTLPQWYRGSCYYPGWAENSETKATMTIVFEGLEIGCIGNTPRRTDSQQFTVTIDGNETRTVGYGDPDPQTYMQWYKSATLPDGRHTILFESMGGVALDMVLVTVGPRTPLDGKTLLIDNEDGQIQYTGQWTRSLNRIVSGYLPDAFPILNSTHQSTTPGDMMVFRFSGTSVSVYGVFNWESLGNLSATYELDGIIYTENYAVKASSPSYLDLTKEATNFVYFSRQNLDPGPHILAVTVTEVNNAVYAFDYITYTPSFSNLASQPDVSSYSVTRPIASSTSLPTQATHIQNNDPPTGNTKSAPVSAIVGGVIGGLALLLLVVAFLCGRRRLLNNAKKRRTLQIAKPYTEETPYMYDGYDGPDFPPSNGSVSPYMLRLPGTNSTSNSFSTYGRYHDRRLSEMRQFSDMSSLHPSHSASQVRRPPISAISEDGETEHDKVSPYILRSPAETSSLLP
ncbi:hypothetical protein CVT24_002485 [Panaeolus cyanescens]|uniref:Transmembrane protein n=1 Tax=Panaeolus cyanescens TaxID=181874 RepID=A0A409YTP2_9AGAR|nr:hypothetical protein CVT24_002485 [Panaeolus cyanescens]